MDEMTHERCSELLREHVRGELPRELADEVRAHLEGCVDCAAEERALAALVGPEHPGLDDVERARLHRALTRELFATPANADLASHPQDARWKRWIAPALGSAAAVLIAVLVLTAGGIGGIGGSDDADMGAAGTGRADDFSGDGPEALQDDGGGGGNGTTADSNKPVRSSAAIKARPDAAGEETTTFGFDEGPQPEFDPDAGELTAEELSAIGRGSPLFRSFAAGYTVDDVDALRVTFLHRLANSSGAPSAQARRCARTLPDDAPILPAYGATGSYDGRDALVLGFVTNDAGSRALDRYLMWVWAKGSCRHPIDTLFERIDR